MFHLKQSEEELGRGKDYSNPEYVRHLPQVPVSSTGAGFSNDLEIKFEVPAGKWWYPRKSFLSLPFKLEYKGANGRESLGVETGNRAADELTESKSAIASGMASCLFSKIEFRIKNTLVSSVRDYVPQIDSLKTRLTKSDAWMKTQGVMGAYGTTVQQRFYDHTMSRRPAAAPLDDFDVDGQLEWTPCLSIFDIDHALPSGEYSIKFSVDIDALANKAIQAVGDAKYAAATTVKPTGFEFITYQVSRPIIGPDGKRLDTFDYFIDLEEIDVKTVDIKSGANSVNRSPFTIQPSTFAVSVAFQDAVPSALNPVSLFYNQARWEKSLTRIRLDYAGQIHPKDEFELSYESDYSNSLRRLYQEDMNAIGMQSNDGGCESFRDWLERGLYYHTNFDRDITDKSTSLTVNTSFSQNTAAGTFRMLVFCHYRKNALVKIANGQVVDVRVSDN